MSGPGLGMGHSRKPVAIRTDRSAITSQIKHRTR